MIGADKREGESIGSFLFRFNKKIKRSGVMKEVRKRRFRSRTQNRNKRRSAALYRLEKRKVFEKEKKNGNAKPRR